MPEAAPRSGVGVEGAIDQNNGSSACDIGGADNGGVWIMTRLGTCVARETLLWANLENLCVCVCDISSLSHCVISNAH